MNKPRADGDRRRSSSDSVGTLVANINNTLQPIVDTILSSTEPNQNMYVSAKTSSSKNINVVEQTTISTLDLASPLLSTSIDDLQQHKSNDISILAHNAANISGFSPEVCKHILLEFIKLKRQRVQMPTFSLMKSHQPHLSTLRRYHLFYSLLTLPIIVLDVIRRFSLVLLDISVCDKNPYACDRFRFLSWLFSQWY